MIEFLKYLLLGLIQGIAEVLPISSSAHLIIAQNILNVSDNSLTFEVFLHLASLIAVMIYLWPKFWRLLKGFCLYVFKKQKEYKLEFKYCLFIVVSTIPTVIMALVLGDFVDKVGSTLWAVGMLLCINAIMLLILPRIEGNRKEEDLNIVDAIVIGCFQCAGVFPGISRSGSCLCGAFSCKIEKETATDYAFVMFIPAVVGATVLQVYKLIKAGELAFSNVWFLYIDAFLVAGVTTYFAFKFLLMIIRKGKISWFSLYCAIIGVSVIIYDIVK